MPSNSTRDVMPTRSRLSTVPGNLTPSLEQAAHSVSSGLALHAGHGLNFENTAAVARLAHMAELNIGHSIVSRAVFVGLERAVQEMKRSYP